MPTRVDPEALARLRHEHPDLSQRELAELAGVSQATVSRALGPDPDPARDAGGEEAEPRPARIRDPIERLARRIETLELTALLAEDKKQFGASVTAQKEAAKMQKELDRLLAEREASAPLARKLDPDEQLIADLVSLIPELPDPAFEALEDAVGARRRRAAEADRDGG